MILQLPAPTAETITSISTNFLAWAVYVLAAGIVGLFVLLFRTVNKNNNTQIEILKTHIEATHSQSRSNEGIAQSIREQTQALQALTHANGGLISDLKEELHRGFAELKEHNTLQTNRVMDNLLKK